VQLEPPPDGVQVGVPIVPNVPCVGKAPLAKLNEALSTSLADKVITNAVSSAVLTLWPDGTGASFTDDTVTLTVAGVEFDVPSLVMNVKLSVPL
jgi:hypothetical protein